MMKKVVLEEVANCPECRSSHIVQDHWRGERVCKDCGLVVDDECIDLGPEWRAFDQEQKNDRSRTGAPVNFSLPDNFLRFFA